MVPTVVYHLDCESKEHPISCVYGKVIPFNLRNLIRKGGLELYISPDHFDVLQYVLINSKLQHPPPPGILTLKLLLVKLSAPRTRLVVKCLAMWMIYVEMSLPPGTRKNKFVLISLFNSTVVLFTHTTVFV